VKRFLLLSVVAVSAAHAATLQPGGVELLCHRSANEDVPENTLESIEQAALLGCNVVEIDLRRTLDGRLVLNHDGILDRVTDGTGDTEKTYYDELALRDAGSWMGERFAGMRIALFEDALWLARQKNIRLVLDIKTKGIGAEVLETLHREGMLERVQFNGQWKDVKQLYPDATSVSDGTIWVQPGVTAEQVKTYHTEGKAVVANFSDNPHEMDLAGMKAAVAAGVDGINVDYPRLGADAVGRPVERTLHSLTTEAGNGDSAQRTTAILQLSRYRGFLLQEQFGHWLLDPDDRVSRAAAVALVTARPETPADAFETALHNENADARANAAWALGELRAPASLLLPLLRDKDARVLGTALAALARAPGEVRADVLLPLLKHESPMVRGSAALALAQHQPEIALSAIPAQLHSEMKAAIRLGDDYARRGQRRLTHAESDDILGHFRCQMKMMQALSMLHGAGAIQALEEQAFRSGNDSAKFNAIVASFQLWDRIGADPQLALDALGSPDQDVADRAEWMLVQGGRAVQLGLRKSLRSENSMVRQRAIRIVAWQGDRESRATLQAMLTTDPADAALAAWALKKIDMLDPDVALRGSGSEPVPSPPLR
jgi:glycerophosphoryl diester phosphodiesterase/HEAT repeat protein